MESVALLLMRPAGVEIISRVQAALNLSVL